MTLRTDMEAKIATLHEELARAEAKVAAFNDLGSAKELATEIHEQNCHRNHTDGCGWFYDKNGWTQSERAKYLTKAENILTLIDLPTALKVLGFLL